MCACREEHFREASYRTPNYRRQSLQFATGTISAKRSLQKDRSARPKSRWTNQLKRPCFSLSGFPPACAGHACRACCTRQGGKEGPLRTSPPANPTISALWSHTLSFSVLRTDNELITQHRRYSNLRRQRDKRKAQSRTKNQMISQL